MSFERLAFQVWIEANVGCSDLANWASYKARLENFQFTSPLRSDAAAAVVRDASSLLHKGLLTFTSAYADVCSNNRAWSVVKLYYSMFYAIRSRLAARHHALVRNQSWYYFDLNARQPAARKLKGHRYRNDHEAALHLYEEIFSSSDRLLSNDIDGVTPFSWMMELRNIANYRAARFADPDFLFDFTSPVHLPSAADFDALIAQNLADTGDVLLFQPEHAWIALPMKQLIAAASEASLADSPLGLSVEQHKHTIAAVDSLPIALRTALSQQVFFRSL